MITSIKIPSQLQLILLMTRRKGAEARRNYAAFKRIEIKHSILAGTHFLASACSASQMCKSQGRKCDRRTFSPKSSSFQIVHVAPTAHFFGDFPTSVLSVSPTHLLLSHEAGDLSISVLLHLETEQMWRTHITNVLSEQHAQFLYRICFACQGVNILTPVNPLTCQGVNMQPF